MRQSITVAIVTRNRAKDLHDCLSSLLRQNRPVDTTLIINNNSIDNTSEVVKNFSKKLHILEIKEHNIGYPSVYNRALRAAPTKWIAFIDDDCVADKGWYGEVIKETKHYPNMAALFGPSDNFYPTNPYACAFQFSNEWWRMQATNGTHVLDYRALDSRNIVYNKPLLFKRNIQFDETFILGAEDSDMGLQINQKGLNAVYIGRMLVYHKEPNTACQYWRKKNAYSRSWRVLEKKWGSEQRAYNRRTQSLFIRRSIQKSTEKLNIINKVRACAIIVLDIIYSKFRMYAGLIKI